MFGADCPISLPAFPDVLHVFLCSGVIETWLYWFIDCFSSGCVNAGSARVKPTSPATVRRGRCGLRKLLKWNQRSVSTDLVSSVSTWRPKCLLRHVNQTSVCAASESHFHCVFLLPSLLSGQWLVWVKPTKMLPTVCGCSPMPNPAPTASLPYRKTRAATTCSVQR